MKKRLGFVSNSSSSSFTVVAQECDWCDMEMPNGNPFPVVSNGLRFCCIECCNYFIQYEQIEAERVALEEEKKPKPEPEPLVEVERFELMDFD